MKWRSFWGALCQPSLSRRIAFVVLAVLPLVALEILAWEYYRFRDQVANHAGIQSTTEDYTAYLLRTPEADRVVALRTLVDDINYWRSFDPETRPGRAAALWLAPGGNILYESDPRMREVLSAQALGRDDRELAGRAHWGYRVDSPLGSLRMAEPQRAAGQALWRVARQLQFYLLIACPVLLLPLWLALHRGLRPLRGLVQRLAQRDVQDLRPLGVNLPQAELKPLGQAFDAMLDRLRLQRERERQFVQEAAHELRTPLAVIGAQAHVLRRANDTGQREQAAQALDAAVARAAHLSRQLLTLASIESIEAAVPERATDLAEQTRAQLAGLLPLAEARDIELVLEAPDQLSSCVPPPLWRSLLGNLVDNALRYCPEGSRIEVRLAELGEGVYLQVADDGPGIAEADRPRVFERFWRADQTLASGSGLGLAIVRQVVQRLGGIIAVGPGLQGRGVSFSASGLAPKRRAKAPEDQRPTSAPSTATPAR